MSDPMDSNQVQSYNSESIAQSPSPSALPLPNGVYMIRRGHDQKPHCISVPITKKDMKKHKKKTGGKPGKYPLTLNDSGEERSTIEFKSSYELVSVLSDSAIAHKHLYEDAKKLHGNISPNTIFINEHGKGVLVDWDHCPLAYEMTRNMMRDLNYGDRERKD